MFISLAFQPFRGSYWLKIWTWIISSGHTIKSPRFRGFSALSYKDVFSCSPWSLNMSVFFADRWCQKGVGFPVFPMVLVTDIWIGASSDRCCVILCLRSSFFKEMEITVNHKMLLICGVVWSNLKGSSWAFPSILSYKSPENLRVTFAITWNQGGFRVCSKNEFCCSCKEKFLFLFQISLNIG